MKNFVLTRVLAVTVLLAAGLNAQAALPRAGQPFDENEFKEKTSFTLVGRFGESHGVWVQRCNSRNQCFYHKQGEKVRTLITRSNVQKFGLSTKPPGMHSQLPAYNPQNHTEAYYKQQRPTRPTQAATFAPADIEAQFAPNGEGSELARRIARQRALGMNPDVDAEVDQLARKLVGERGTRSQEEYDKALAAARTALKERVTARAAEPTSRPQVAFTPRDREELTRAYLDQKRKVDAHKQCMEAGGTHLPDSCGQPPALLDARKAWVDARVNAGCDRGMFDDANGYQRCRDRVEAEAKQAADQALADIQRDYEQNPQNFERFVGGEERVRANQAMRELGLDPNSEEDKKLVEIDPRTGEVKFKGDDPAAFNALGGENCSATRILLGMADKHKGFKQQVEKIGQSHTTYQDCAKKAQNGDYQFVPSGSQGTAYKCADAQGVQIHGNGGCQVMSKADESQQAIKRCQSAEVRGYCVPKAMAGYIARMAQSPEFKSSVKAAATLVKQQEQRDYQALLAKLRAEGAFEDNGTAGYFKRRAAAPAPAVVRIEEDRR